MTIIFFIALVIYLGICGVLVTLIMMQEGKGGGLSGVMGSSMGETFGFGGASKQVRKYTALCATVFMVMTIVLTFLGESTFRSTSSKFIGTDSGTPAVAPAPAPSAVTPAAGTAAVSEGATPGQVTPANAAPVQVNPAESAPVAPAESNAAPAPAESSAAPAPAATPAS